MRERRDRNDIREKQMPEDKKRKPGSQTERRRMSGGGGGGGGIKLDLVVCHKPFPAFLGWCAIA